MTTYEERTGHRRPARIGQDAADPFTCAVCGGSEAGLTTRCCGRRMTSAEREAVAAGRLDYRDGWVEEDAE